MKKWVLTPDKYLKPDEAALLRSYLEDKALAAIVKKKKKPIRDWAMIDIALSAGLRPSEIGNLTVKDAYLGKGESALFVKNGKGKKDRLVLIGDKLKKHLKDHLSWKKQAGEAITPDSYLFVSDRGPKMTLSAIQKRFKHSTKACGLNSRYSIRSARHTYGTMLYRATKDLRMVQKQLGHSNIQVTEVYADVLKEDVEKAVNALYA